MRNIGLVLSAAVVLLAGCSSRSEPTTKLGNETVPAEAHGRTDPFGLPLEIVLEPPPVPKEVEGPSRPIKETPKAPAKKSSPGPFKSLF
jgi:hypothetical protein